MSSGRYSSRARAISWFVAAGFTAGCNSGRHPSTDSLKAGGPRQTTATAVASEASSDKSGCPATGLWAECSAFKALDRAGLAPRRDSSASAVHVDPLARPGTRILLGGAELDLFIYPSESERARDEARLDKHQFIEASDEPTLRGEPTLIRNVNLLAILRSRNDHQRERVSDALSAGPPQASHAATIPGSTSR